MYNLARAAEDGWQGTVGAARDYARTWNGPVLPAAPAACRHHAESL
jgi:hypothetical protein